MSSTRTDTAHVGTMTTDLDLDAIERTATGATRGPWTWTDHRIPDLEGRAGEPDVYEYSSTVLEASHWGECGCRSACTLELDISDADKAHITAASPDVVIALIARLRVAEEALASLNRAIGTDQ